MLCSILLAAFVCYVIWLFVNCKDPAPIFGVYKQPGKWYPMKYAAFLLMMKLRKWRGGDDFKKDGNGAIVPNRPECLDRQQPLSDHPKAFDAVFYLGSSKGGLTFAMGSERRKRGKVHGLLYFSIPGKGLLCSPKLPDTMLFGSQYQKAGVESPFGAEGLLSEPIEPMKKWRLSYDGKMRYQSNPDELVDVVFDADWTSTFRHFDFDTDLHPSVVARSIARETWSKGYFEDLKLAHQSHYEQMGSLRGTLKVNGEVHNLDMMAFRDHSFGHKRDWELMHRYAFFMFFLEDGTSGTVGIISQPCTCSSFETGYVVLPTGKIHPLEWCDFQLFEHGEGGTPPTDCAFQFKAGPKIYTVQATVDQQAVHYVGADWEARMVERFMTYVVDGVPGHGVSEFHYRHTGGRPDAVAINDPEWYRKVREIGKKDKK